MKNELIYVGDPLCGWCFGFTTIFEHIAETYGDIFNISIIMGGLKVKNSISITKEIKEFISQNWSTVMNRTGQHFAIDLVSELPDGDYNSEPPCRAVVTVRHLKPEAALPYYKAVHTAMYMNAKNINDPELLCELAVQTGISETDFYTYYYSDEMKTETKKDFDFSEKSGVLGFPAFVLVDETGPFVLNQGYKSLNDIERGIEGWLRGEKTIIF